MSLAAKIFGSVCGTPTAENCCGHSKGAKSEVTSVAITPDGKRVLAGSFQSLFIWDAESGRLIRNLAHPQWVFSVAVSPDGSRIASGGEDHLIRLWDMKSGQLLRTLEGHTGTVVSIAFSADGSRILSGSEDTTFKIWKAETGELIGTVVVGRGQEWLTITRSGFFAASQRGAEMLNIVRGVTVTTIGQVHQALFNPDLVRETLAGDPSGEAARAADLINLDKVLDSGPPPAVTLLPRAGGNETTTDLVTLQAHITDQGKGIGRIEWRLNGVTAGVITAPANAGSSYEAKLELALDPGENLVEVIAYDARNILASVSAQTTLTYTGPADGAKPRLHVLAIGINNYVDKGWIPPGATSPAWFPPLKLAVGDARALGAALKAASGDLYSEVRVRTVLDEEASKGGLDAAISQMSADINPRDTFILFAAAHGYSIDGRFYLIPQDYQGGNNPESLG